MTRETEKRLAVVLSTFLSRRMGLLASRSSSRVEPDPPHLMGKRWRHALLGRVGLVVAVFFRLLMFLVRNKVVSFGILTAHVSSVGPLSWLGPQPPKHRDLLELFFEAHLVNGHHDHLFYQNHLLKHRIEYHIIITVSR